MKEKEPRTIERHYEFESGGTLTFKHGKDDVVTNAIGHLINLPDLFFYGEPKDIFKNPPKELMDELYERYKDVPWKGDLLVRIGYDSIIEDYKRLFGKDIKGRANVFLRLLAVPMLWRQQLEAKLSKSNYYSPLTHSVTVYHPRLHAGMHELGHAEFFDQSNHRELWSLVPVLSGLSGMYLFRNPASSTERRLKKLLVTLPGFKFFMEWKASQNAMKRYKSRSEQVEAMKSLEPRFGGYVGHEIGNIVDIFGKERSKFFDRLLNKYKPVELGFLVGVLSGHAAARIPKDRTSSFGVLFQQEKPAPNNQLFYGSSQS